MKQSDILSFAINGVQRELSEAREHVIVLEEVMEELLEIENQTESVEENNIGRPAEFVPNCTRCRQDPCICVGM